MTDRNLKSEIRMSKSETNPKSKPEKEASRFGFSSSGFGFVSDFGFRVSDFPPSIWLWRRQDLHVGARAARVAPDGAFQGQPQDKHGGLPRLALHHNVAAVLAENLAADCQPQSCALGSLCADEGFEDIGDIL